MMVYILFQTKQQPKSAGPKTVGGKKLKENGEKSEEAVEIADINEDECREGVEEESLAEAAAEDNLPVEEVKGIVLGSEDSEKLKYEAPMVKMLKQVEVCKFLR